MSLNESIVEDAALEWFGELGYAVGHGVAVVSWEPAECDSLGESKVSIVRRYCGQMRTLTKQSG